MYKTKLNQLCQKKRWQSPEYSCIKDGQDHNPLFRASVVVNGFTFLSPAPTKSSKCAHDGAAKLAFSHLTTSSQEEIPTSENQKPKTPKVPNMSSCSDSDTDEEIPPSESQKLNPTMISSSDFDTGISSKRDDMPNLSVSGPNNTKKCVESYLLCNKVRVYTSIPTMELPMGIVVLPIGDNKWTLVSLEFA